MEEAKALASIGLRMVPLHEDTRHPTIKNWQKRAVRKPERIPTVFDGVTPFNLGVCIGKRHVVIDVDPRNGGFDSMAKLADEFGCPPLTAMSWTPNEGYHLMFRTKKPVQTRINRWPGIDILGVGSLMTVPPSRRHGYGQVYEWNQRPEAGIALLPGWLEGFLNGTARSQMREGGRPIGNRSSDPRALAVELIKRFPVTGYGQRHCQMVRAIGSLIGRGYRPDLAFEAMEVWHGHFLGLGKTRTLVAEGLMEIEATIGATLSNDRFYASVAVPDHGEVIARIVLTEGQQGLIRKGVVTSEGLKAGSNSGRPTPPLGTPLVIGLTQIDAIGKRLCESRDEEAFVTSVLLHVEHELSATKDGRVRMTDAQVQEIAARRFDGIKWGPQQVERLKSKYLARPADDKPATRFELMRELAKGSRRTGQAVGTPSEYLPTGLLALLSASDNMDFAAGVASAAGEAAA